MNSSGSAMAENAKWMDSIEGKSEQLANAMQALWNNTITSDVIKRFLDAALALTKIIDKLGVIKTLAIAIGTYFTKDLWGNLFSNKSKDSTNTIDQLTALRNKAAEAVAKDPSNKKKRQELSDLNDAMNAYQNFEQQQKEFNSQLDSLHQKRAQLAEDLKVAEQNRANLAQQGIISPQAGAEVDRLKQEIADTDDAIQNTTQSMQTLGTTTQQTGTKGSAALNKLKTTLANILTSMAMMYIITTAIGAIQDAINNATEEARENDQSVEALNEKYSQLSSELSECNSQLQSLEADLDTTNKQIEELLSQGTLSFVEQEELERLQSVSAELERQISMTKTLQSSLQTGTNAAAVQAGEALLNSSFSSKQTKTERQEAAEEEGSKKWQLGGMALGALAAAGIIAATAATGGGAAAILPALGAGFSKIGITSAVVGTAGSILGGKAASAKEGQEYDQEQTVEEAIRTMNSTRDALVKARNDTYAAYASNPMDEDLAADYEDAAASLSTYDETMANHISQLAQYYNTITSIVGWDKASEPEKVKAKEYGDIIDKYNIMMGGINAKENAIARIFGVEADEELLSVKKALEAAAEAGEKIDLKAAFGNNTAAYDDFVKRLYDMGIYVYELENRFYELEEAEKAAANVSFVDVAKDIKAVAATITGMKDALAEFFSNGTASVDTILDLEEYFKTYELEDEFNRYVSVMLDGASSIEDARQITEETAKAYLEKAIAMGDLTGNQKQIYVSLFKKMGVTNAEDFLTHQLQSAGIEQIQAKLNSKTEDNALKVMSDIMAIAKAYDIETDSVTNLIAAIEQKNDLENQLSEANKNKNAYDTFLNGNDQEKGYLALSESIDIARQAFYDYRDKKKEIAEDVLNFDPDNWFSIIPGAALIDKSNPLTGGMTRAEYNRLTEEYNKAKPIIDAYNQAKDEYHAIKDALQTKIQEGVSQGWMELDESTGLYNLVDGVDASLQAVVDEINKSLDDAEGDIDAFTVDYELEIAAPDIQPAVNTISGLTEAFNQYKSAVEMANEVFADGQVISEEYYNALNEQLLGVTVGAEDFSDAIDTSNGYVVKNADLLKNLTKQAQKLQQNNVKLARSQSRLEYYKLVKQMSDYIKVENGVVVTDAKQVKLLAEKASYLQKIINRYSMLELQLLGVSDAYDALAKAQEADAEVDYISTVEDAVMSLGEAFNTARLGTETAQAAIDMLIPKDIWDGIEALDTAEEKMAAIYDYYKNGKIAQYFSLEFDDDGNITSAEAKLGNIRKFIEDGIGGDYNKDGVNVFKGTWTDFEYTEEFIENLSKQEDKLGYFAEQMGITKEMAFALIKATEDLNIGYLDGNLGSLFDILLPHTLENDIYNVTEAISSLNQQLADGKIDAKEYAKQMYGVQGAFDQGIISEEEYNAEISKWNEQKAKGQVTDTAYNEAVYGVEGAEAKLYEQASDQAVTWLEKSEELEAYQKQLDSYNQMLQGAEWQDGKLIGEDGQEINLDMDAYTATWNKVQDLKAEKQTLEEPTEFTIQFALDETEEQLDELQASVADTIGPIIEGRDYFWSESLGEFVVAPTIATDSEEYNKLMEFVALMNKKHTLELGLGEDVKPVEETMSDIAKTLDDIATILQTGFEFIINDDGQIAEFKRRIDEATQDRTTTVTVEYKSDDPSTWSDFRLERNYAKYANGTAHTSGTAYSNGNWGAPKTETALTGELGPELLVRGNRWSLVGEHGAEFTQVKKNDIIFNHKQTEEILKHGYTTSRGKAYASGTTKSSGAAYAFLSGYTGSDVTIFPYGSSQTQWDGTGYDSWDDPTYDLQSALNDAADSVGEFEEALDWIEIRMEELDERLGILNARLENAGNYNAKDSVFKEMLSVYKAQYENAQAGAAYYENYAAQFLEGMSSELVEAAKNGSIAISDFTKEADEATVEAIKKYRDYIQKASDLTQKAEEVLTEIRDWYFQRIDSAEHSGKVKADVEASQTEKLQNVVDFDELRGLITDPHYYAAMMENSERTIAYLTKSRDAMQAVFDEALAAGQFTNEDGTYTDAFYEQLDKLYQIDAEIDNATNQLEEFQNAINDIYWDSFDQLINRFDYISDEAQGLIDIMSEADMVSKPDNDNGWGEDDVEWTKEGLATLGLHAQELERAEVKAAAYATAIDDLNAEYKAGHYSEAEYLEKLNELQKGQTDAIKTAQQEKKAIVDLNKERVDAIKEGIELQIDAYSELIDKKKEALQIEKD